MTKITMQDFRACGICPDARHWFARNGLDWRDFVKHGIDVADLRATGDQLDRIDALEQAAKTRGARDGRR